ncbi:hypothetical protein L2E82_10530 [Cichorium intybus]|uniref:Uncharacterized protein n=1 Tax=Cichorium intybus TaxID=13427 RepID=A0ACB9GBF0_CICIN|nr:hypothetical protein L2E82_10530 [Cichorium intybus]
MVSLCYRGFNDGQFGYTYVATDKANGDRVAAKKIDKNKVHLFQVRRGCLQKKGKIESLITKQGRKATTLLFVIHHDHHELATLSLFSKL